MADMFVVLSDIRRNFSFLWDDFGFRLAELKPRDGYRNSGYEVFLENEYCKLLFMSEGGILEEIYVRTKQSPYFGRGLERLTSLLTGKELKSFYLTRTAEDEYFQSIASYIRSVLPEIMDMVKTPAIFKETIETLEATRKSEPITIEAIRAERARLDALGLDSSLGAAIENLRKRGKNE
jgi:hypothetical protein